MFCTRARAHVRVLMTQKSCAVGMRNAKPGNHLNCDWCEQRNESVQIRSNSV